MEWTDQAVLAMRGNCGFQSIPIDEALWKVENYPAFVEARRGLLAAAANRTRMPCMRSMTTSMSAEVFQSGRACYLDRLAREREGPCVTDSELRTWGVCPGGEEEDRLDGCVLDPTDVLLRISGKTYAVLRAVWDSRKKLGSLIDPPDPDDRDDVPIPLGGIT